MSRMELAKPKELGNVHLCVTRRGLKVSKHLRRDKKWSSYKERKGNALALGADEGRG